MPYFGMNIQKSQLFWELQGEVTIGRLSLGTSHLIWSADSLDHPPMLQKGAINPTG
jgi:hypothetical protein